MSKLSIAEQIEKVGYYVPIEFTDDDKLKSIQSRSSTIIKFPKYREKFFKEHFEKIIQILKEKTVECEVNFLKGEIELSTSSSLFDPSNYFNAIDFIKLISRGMDLETSQKIFQDEITSSIVSLPPLCKNKKVFINRRNRLFGPDGITLKAIQLLTKTDIVIQGGTMTILGNEIGVKRASKIGIDAMNNIHPVLNINKFMVLKELENNPEMEGKDWSSLLPKVTKNHLTKKEKSERSKKKVAKNKNKKDTDSNFTDFDKLLPKKSKIDEEIESGRYFLEKKDLDKKKIHLKKVSQNARSAENQLKKQEKFIPPSENKFSGKRDLSSKNSKINAKSLKKKMDQ